MQRVADLLKNDCCIFVGAGIPNAIGFPLWSKLAEDLIEFTWSERSTFVSDTFTYSVKQELSECVDRGMLIRAITYCRDLFRNVNRERDYQAKIVDYLHSENKYSLARTNPVYMQVGKLLEKAIVLQTNLDKSIEEYCRMTTYINTNLPNTTSMPCLVYLHGIITDPTSWIMTRDEYDKFYQLNTSLTNFVQMIFRQNNVLFLGYSLSDKEILDQIVKVKGAGKQYILVLEEVERNKSANVVLENELKYYGITVVRYNVEQDGYEAFARFLEKVVSLLTPSVQVARQGEDGSKING